MPVERLSKRRKRKRVNYDETDERDSEFLEEEDDGEKLKTELQQSLAQYEAEDLDDLTSIASEAILIEFNSPTGRPIRRSRPPSSSVSS